jgi:hypothetical protein
MAHEFMEQLEQVICYAFLICLILMVFIFNICCASRAIRETLPRSLILRSQVIGEVRTAPLKPHG